MMNREILYVAHATVFGLGFLALMLAASEAGFRLGRRPNQPTREKAQSQISTIEAGILGVLGLLLGFTMSMAVTRFEMRKQLVLDEANAIRTAYLRIQLLPAAKGQEIANLLRDYVDIRIPSDIDRPVYHQIAAGRQEAVRLQNAFWQRAIAYRERAPNPELAGLLLQSLNKVIDLEAARWIAFQDQVPAAVICVIAVVGLLAAMVVGYTIGLGGLRQQFSISVLSLAITIVLAVIIDIDWPHEGIIRVSQQHARSPKAVTVTLELALNSRTVAGLNRPRANISSSSTVRGFTQVTAEGTRHT